MRVLVAGLGSASGTGIGRALEHDPKVEAIAGFDLEPPRRWMRRADFQFAHPGDTDRIDRIVREFRPTIVVHAWVFEPRARSSPGQARERTVVGTETLLSAIAKVESVEHIVVRSATSVYGKGRNTRESPTIHTPARPTSHFGKMLTWVEERCAESAESLGATMSTVRLASIMASHLPNPLGRYLRQRIVAVPINRQRFGVVHLDDAAAVVAAAATTRHDGVLNVMATGPLTVVEAVRIGGRYPIPVLPAVIRAGRLLADVSTAPLPEHVAELLTRGDIVETTDLASTIGVKLKKTTRDAVADMYTAGRLIEIDVSRKFEQPYTMRAVH